MATPPSQQLSFQPDEPHGSPTNVALGLGSVFAVIMALIAIQAPTADAARNSIDIDTVSMSVDTISD
jgi:hypothetical protein